MKLSIAIATFNEEKKIKRTLKSVTGWVDEIVIVDGNSTDKTVEIAKEFTDKIFSHENELMFHKNKNLAIEKCTGEWILFLDADEVITNDLKHEITEAMRNNNFNGYDMPRANYFLGRFSKKGGQYPDVRIRLFKNGKGRWPCKSVHEQMEVDGEVGHLRNDLLHYSYESFGEYWKKADTYTLLTAEIIKKENVNAVIKFFKYFFWMPVYTFFNIYFRHKGFMDSWQGFIFALFSGLHFTIAYVKSFI